MPTWHRAAIPASWCSQQTFSLVLAAEIQLLVSLVMLATMGVPCLEQKFSFVAKSKWQAVGQSHLRVVCKAKPHSKAGGILGRG